MAANSEREGFRKRLLTRNPTPPSKLRELEKELYSSKVKNLQRLKQWMENKGFYNLNEDFLIKRLGPRLIGKDFYNFLDNFGIIDRLNQFLDQLIRNLSRKMGFKNNYKFSLTDLIGAPEFSDFQMFKSFGKKPGKLRWHWRVYIFSDRIIIVSELENDPIGNMKDLSESIGRHFYKDIILPMNNPKKGPKKYFLCLYA